MQAQVLSSAQLRSLGDEICLSVNTIFFLTYLLDLAQKIMHFSRPIAQDLHVRNNFFFHKHGHNSLWIWTRFLQVRSKGSQVKTQLVLWIFILFNPLNPELNPICCLLALLGAHHFLHVGRIRVKSLTFRRLMSYIYGTPILDVSRSHTTTQHSR